MTETSVTHPPRQGDGIASFAGQILKAALLTAAIGAVVSTFYEFFFYPDAYAAGPVLGRAAFAFAFPLPFIFAGLLILGSPVALVLSRLQLDNLIVFGVAGALAGAAIGLAMASGLPRLQIAFAVYGFVSATAYWAVRRRRV